MNSITTLEALKRIQEQERWLEVHGLLEPIFTKMDCEIYRSVIEQVALFEGD